VQVAGVKGVPSMQAGTPPKAVVLNVTVTNPTASSYLTLWPDGNLPPLASDLNYRRGQTVANLVVVQVGADGKVRLFNPAGSVDVVIDIVGWYG
jgi:serine protease